MLKRNVGDVETSEPGPAAKSRSAADSEDARAERDLRQRVAGEVGKLERILRGAGAVGFVVAALLLPMPLWARGVGLGLGAYLIFTALAGTCLGYRLMGRSTCPLQTP